MRKKLPLALAHFEEFFRLLPQRADSEHSWTVDIEERKRRAAEEARPLREQSAARAREAAQWNERLKELKKAARRDEPAIAEAAAKLAELTREARDLANRAGEIEDAVYDLKAVNPHRKPEVDTRTPEELIAFIEAKGREIAEALAALQRG